MDVIVTTFLVLSVLQTPVRMEESAKNLMTGITIHVHVMQHGQEEIVQNQEILVDHFLVVMVEHVLGLVQTAQHLTANV